MNFWDRLDLYLQAVGVQNCGVAWDLARTPLTDEQHVDLAKNVGHN